MAQIPATDARPSPPYLRDSFRASGAVKDEGRNTMDDKNYRGAEVAESLGVTTSEFNDWLTGAQGNDYPQPAGHDEGGPYWDGYSLSAWHQWFEEG